MNKREFESYYLKNMSNIRNVIIRIWNGFDLDNELSSWLEVYFDDSEYTQIFISDNFKDIADNKKELSKLQKQWYKKISNWVSTSWNLGVIMDEQNI